MSGGKKYWTEDKLAYVRQLRDGKRTIEEMARICSEHFGKKITAQAMQTVISRRLGAKNRKIWTDDKLDYIRSICKGKCVNEIAELCTKQFGFVCTPSSIKSVMSAHQIKSGYKYDGRGNFIFNEEQIEWIKQNRTGISFEECTKRFNEYFGTNFKKSQITGFCHAHHLPNGVDCRFKKSQVSHNKGKKGLRFPGSEKGWFKKGSVPKNTLPVKSEVVTKDGYIRVKTGEPNIWELKHRKIWSEAKGEIPEDCCILFLDGNKQNCKLDNLMMVKRGIVAILNHENLIKEDAALTRVGVTMAMIKNRIRELEKNER